MVVTPSAWAKQLKREDHALPDNGTRPTAKGTLMVQLKTPSEVLQSTYNLLDMKVANQAHFCIRQFHGRGLTRLSMPNRARLCSVVPRGGRDIESAFAFSTFGS